MYSVISVPWKRGVILHEARRCRSRLLMGSLYGRLDKISSLYVKSFYDKCKGVQFSIRQTFMHAHTCAPCLFVFEDLDSLVGDEVRSYFLIEVDGLKSLALLHPNGVVCSEMEEEPGA